MSADFSPTKNVDLAGAPDFTIGALRVRPSLREVQGAKATERLQPRVMQALVVLAETQGQVVSRETLLERCWDGRIVGDDAINRCIVKLRRVGAEQGSFGVEAISRVGYRLVVASSPTAVEAPPPRSPPSWRRWLGPVAAASLAALAIAGIVVWRTSPEPLNMRTPFVVTAFTSAKADESLGAFAATTASDINAALARHQLPTSPAGGARIEIRGIVSSEAGRTHMRVGLVAVPASATLWSVEFDAPAGEETGMRAQIASRVVAVAGTANEFLEYPSPDFDAATLSMMIKSVEGVQNNTWNSLTGAEEAVRRSPRYAAAHAQFSTGLIAASVFGSPDQADALRLRAISEARRAIELEPRMPEGSSALMWTMDATDWAGRLKLASRSPFADSTYGKLARGALLVFAGRVSEGMLPLSESMERFGERAGIPAPLVVATRASGKTETAIAYARYFLSLRPSDYGLRALVLDLSALWGDPAETLVILDDADRRPSLATASIDAYRRFATWRKTGAVADRLAAGKAIFAAASAGMPVDSAVPLLSRLGDMDSAFALAGAWASDPKTRYAAMRFNSAFLYFTETAPMRRDPRFIPLVDHLNLLKFWRETGIWPDFCRSEPSSVCGQMHGS